MNPIWKNIPIAAIALLHATDFLPATAPAASRRGRLAAAGGGDHDLAVQCAST
jgi:hypothetical protein